MKQWTRLEKIGVLLLTFGLVLLWNWLPIRWDHMEKLEKMNDVAAILVGYRHVPHLLTESRVWWTGAWIQDGIPVFRPVSSYLLWFDSWLATTHGLFWTGVVGVILFTAVCLLAAALAWRFTRSKFAVLVACVLGPMLPLWNWGGATPLHWLVWYPVHHDLLMIGLLLAALLCFDCWVEKPDNRFLIAAWFLFLAGVLSKEFVYIFPFMAFAVALRTNDRVVRRAAMLHAGCFCMAVLLLYSYRMAVLPDPYQPRHVKYVHMLRKPFLYWFYPYYKYILTEQYWFPGLAALLFGMLGFGAKYWHGYGKRLLAVPFGWSLPPLLMVMIVGVYCQLTYRSAIDAAWFFLEAPMGVVPQHVPQLAAMLLTYYAFWLLWKYRKDEPTLSVFLIFLLSYVPVWTYLGWHYTLAGWMIRAALLWPMVAKLAVRDLRGWAPETLRARLRRSRCLLVAPVHP